MIIDNFYHLIRNDKYMKQLSTWINQWKIDPIAIETLPRTGFVVDNIAALFVYETNSSLCFLDYLISNKEQDKIKTNEAIDILVEHAIKYCHDEGYKFMISNSKYETVVDRAKKHGFNVDENQYRVFGRKI